MSCGAAGRPRLTQAISPTRIRVSTYVRTKPDNGDQRSVRSIRAERPATIEVTVGGVPSASGTSDRPAIRSWLARAARHRVSDLTVLSYSEIPDDQSVKVVHTVEAKPKD